MLCSAKAGLSGCINLICLLYVYVVHRNVVSGYICNTHKCGIRLLCSIHKCGIRLCVVHINVVSGYYVIHINMVSGYYIVHINVVSGYV